MFEYYTLIVIVFVFGIAIGFLISRFCFQNHITSKSSGTIYVDVADGGDPELRLELRKHIATMVHKGYVIFDVEVDYEPNTLR